MSDNIPKYKATDKMSDLICENYTLLMVMSRFGLPLGFGDKNVKEVCDACNVDYKTFLAVVNFMDTGQFVVGGADLSIQALMEYLKNSHSYYLENRMLSIQEQLKEISEGCEQQHQQILNLFFNEYKNEVIRHFDYE